MNSCRNLCNEPVKQTFGKYIKLCEHPTTTISLQNLANKHNHVSTTNYSGTHTQINLVSDPRHKETHSEIKYTVSSCIHPTFT